MDKYTAAVVEYLRDHPGVSNLRFDLAPPAPIARILDWEKANAPHRLPEDLKAFLLLSDGFSLRWDAVVGDETRELGNMTFNGVDRLTRVSLDASPLDDRGEAGARRAPDVVPPVGASDGWRPPRPSAAFDLDTSCACGRVALVFVDDATTTGDITRRDVDAQVWFQDLGARWHVAAETFSEYFRTMTAHLGLPNWQYACTDVGLDPAAAQWYAFFEPERLAVDLERGRLRRSGRSGRARRARNVAGRASEATAATAAGTKVGGGGARGNAQKSSSANASTSVAARARASLEGGNGSARPSSGRKR